MSPNFAVEPCLLPAPAAARTLNKGKTQTIVTDVYALPLSPILVVQLVKTPACPQEAAGSSRVAPATFNSIRPPSGLLF